MFTLIKNQRSGRWRVGRVHPDNKPEVRDIGKGRKRGKRRKGRKKTIGKKKKVSYIL